MTCISTALSTVKLVQAPPHPTNLREVLINRQTSNHKTSYMRLCPHQPSQAATLLTSKKTCGLNSMSVFVFSESERARKQAQDLLESLFQECLSVSVFGFFGEHSHYILPCLLFISSRFVDPRKL